MTNTSKWGGKYWYVGHHVIDSNPEDIPDTKQKGLYDFFSSWRDVLPCKKCRQGYTAIWNAMHEGLTPSQFMQQHFSTRTKARAFINSVHNAVNTKLGKPQATIETGFPYGRYDTTSWWLGLTTLDIVLIGMMLLLVCICVYIWTQELGVRY
jgi:hypothetical protein